MPTPARLATASRLASGPPALNTALAASSTRSRLRTASARGLRMDAAEWLALAYGLITFSFDFNGGDLFSLFTRDVFGKPAGIFLAQAAVVHPLAKRRMPPYMPAGATPAMPAVDANGR